MKPRTFWNVVSIGLALLVPAGVFWSGTPESLRAAGLVIGPFGWPQILVAHLLATLPLGLLIAGLVRRATKPTHPLIEVGICLTLGVVVVWATWSWGAWLGQSFGRDQEDFVSRLVFRLTWCLVLQLPWCLLGSCLCGSPQSFLRLPNWTAIGLALIVAVALPAVYTMSLVEDQTRRMNELIGRGRWMKAQKITVGLDDLPLPPTVARKVADLEAAVAWPLPPKAVPEAVVRRAGMLAALDRLDEARRLLQPLADANPSAGLLLAAIDQDLQRTADSTECYKAVLRLLDEMPESNQVKIWRVDAFDGLAFNARERQDFAGAIAVYHEALKAVPGAEAYFHFQLGRQLHQAGRSSEALYHLGEASRLDPDYTSPASPMMNNIRTHTTGCFLTWKR